MLEEDIFFSYVGGDKKFICWKNVLGNFKTNNGTIPWELFSAIEKPNVGRNFFQSYVRGVFFHFPDWGWKWGF